MMHGLVYILILLITEVFFYSVSSGSLGHTSVG